MKMDLHTKKPSFLVSLFGGLLLALSLVSTPALAEKINLNTADAEALQYIPGIGPGKAERIIEARESAGGFKAFEDLLEISGIGEKVLEGIREHGSLDGGVSQLTDEMRENPPGASESASSDG